MRIGELFAGYGGLGMGVQSVYGGEVAWVSDIDPGANKILAHRFPDVPNLGDITTVDWSAVEPVDVLCGGFPCQDVSAAGKRAGIRPGTRSGLWTHFAYAIAQLRPRTVVIENVRGLLSARAHSDVEPCAWCVGDDTDGALRALGAVLGDLAGLGYDASWHGIRAADVGAPHGRFRIFCVATDARRLGGPQAVEHDGRGAPLGDGSGVPDEPDRDALRSGPDRGLLPTPATSDTNGPGTHGDGGLDLRTAVSLLPTPTTEPTTGNGHARNLGKEAQRLLPMPRSTRGGSGTETMYAAGGERTDAERPQGTLTLVSEARWGDYAAAIARWEHTLGCPAPAPTMTSKKGTPQLSPLFVEWMMGLPAGWVTDVPGITRNEALKALGNGVVPQQAAAALAEMATWAVVA